MSGADNKLEHVCSQVNKDKGIICQACVVTRAWEKKRAAAIGKCCKCGQEFTWFNNVPLTAYCWGPGTLEDATKEHKEVSVVVPAPFQPYDEGFIGPEKMWLSEGKELPVQVMCQ